MTTHLQIVHFLCSLLDFTVNLTDYGCLLLDLIFLRVEAANRVTAFVSISHSNAGLIARISYQEFDLIAKRYEWTLYRPY